MRTDPPLRSVLTRIAVVTLLSAAGACGADARTGDLDLQLKVFLHPDPPMVGDNEVSVSVADVDWSPRNGAHVIVTGLRDGLLLGVDTARGQGAGRYLARGVRFEVAGDWVVRIRVETPDGRWTESEQAIVVSTPEVGEEP